MGMPKAPENIKKIPKGVGLPQPDWDWLRETYSQTSFSEAVQSALMDARCWRNHIKPKPEVKP